MKFNTEIKYLGLQENILFLSTSFFLIWSWVFISMYLENGNDRGLLTICGFIIVTSVILSFFFSKNKVANLLKLLLLLSLVCILTFILTLAIGLSLVNLIGADWIGFLIPILIVGISFYLVLRQLIAFPNNKLAFWTFIAIAALTIIGFLIFKHYYSIAAHDFRIGFPIGVFLTLLCISIGILCGKKNKHENL